MLGAEKAIRENYVKTGQVQLLFNPMVDFGDPSLQAHQAAECAGEQGQFWAMHDQLFERQRELFGDPQTTAQAIAAELGLDTAQFNTCLAEQRYAELVQTLDQARRQSGIRTRPTFDINGQLVVGAQGYDAFKGVIDAKLAE